MGASFAKAPGEPKDLFTFGLGMPFTRRGAWFGVFADGSARTISGTKLYIGSRRGSTAERRGMNNKAFTYICPAYNGEKLDYKVSIPTAFELEMITAYGKITLCFADKDTMYIKGENGLQLAFERDQETHEVMKKRGTGWIQTIQWMGTMLYTPLKGTIDMKADWDYEKLSTPRVRGLLLPDENGEFLMACSESVYDQIQKDSYVTYEEALEDVKADWNEYVSHFNDAGEFNDLMPEALWTMWSFITSPSMKLEHPLIYMTGNAMASSWQMIQNAVAMKDNVPLRNEFLINMLDEISPNGQFPDFIDDFRSQPQGLKPPIQGWGLKWIMKNHDLKAEIPAETLERIYKGYSGWYNWFMNYRDDDHDGLPQHEHGDDTGFDDSTAFVNYSEVEAPDLPSYLAILAEALGDVAKMLDKPAEAEEWYGKSKALIDLMIKELWNGEMFICRTSRTHETIISDSLLHYTPIVLGNRLPAEIIEKLTKDLMVEGEFLSPMGLASERITSQQYRMSGMARGFVLPPYHILMVTGMYDAGKVAEAKEIGSRYCAAMRRGFNFLLDPVRPSFGSFGCSWPVCTFLVLANMIANM